MEHFGVKMVDGTYTSKFVPSQNLTKTTRKAVFWFWCWFWFFRILNLQGGEVGTARTFWKSRGGWMSHN